MSSALRKKIGLATGLPPSLLSNKAFWQGLLDVGDEWFAGATGSSAPFQFSVRQSLAREAATARLGVDEGFYFRSESPLLLCAVRLCEAAALQVASKRIGQDAAQLSDASPLFVRLLCEQPAIELWRVMSMVALARREPDEPIIASAFEDGEADDPDRYIFVRMSGVLNGTNANLELVFHQERLTAALAGLRAAPVGGREAECGLRSRIAASTLELDAVLEALPMTLGECSRLEEGDLIQLPGTRLDAVELRAQMLGGVVSVAAGAMGVWRRQRAFQLKSAVDSELFAEVKAIEK